ncbi:hypothetical protein EHO59_18095 [Leptospira semungkisensis]|uniref:Uncharacterized protein n=1 Tax=Leptospira semungkisensis TaxID=2484985 RepID=A0A4V3JAI7_9LEPT|nr:hypothetical protein [Leptospira semungkisensis]TGJ98678.1 hypothetical protein EHO59_18095 [Leptospira semungkisensis]
MKLFEKYAILLQFSSTGFSVRNTSSNITMSYNYKEVYPNYPWLYDEELVSNLKNLIDSTYNSTRWLKSYFFISVPIEFNIAERQYIRTAAELALAREIFILDDPLSFALGKFSNELMQKSKFLFVSPLFVTHCFYESGEIAKSTSYGLGNISEEIFKLEDYDFAVIDNDNFAVSRLKSKYYTNGESSDFIFAGLFYCFEKFILKRNVSD